MCRLDCDPAPGAVLAARVLELADAAERSEVACVNRWVCVGDLES